MTIKKIYLQIDDKGENYGCNSDFLFETNFITEYLSRDIGKLKFVYSKSNKLTVYIEAGRNAVEYSDVFKSLRCYMEQSYSDISELKFEERTEKILEVIEASAKLYEKVVSGLGEAIVNSAQSFRENNYKNVWLHNKRRIKGVGDAKLICELSRENFYLDFVIENKFGDVIYHKRLLTEMPDSLCYHHKFKNIQLHGDNVVVVDRAEKIFFEKKIKTL